MSKKVVCAIVIGDLETKHCDTYWLKENECYEYTELLKEFINKNTTTTLL